MEEGVRILVVEDEVTVARFIDRCLQRFGYTVTCVATAAEGERLVAEGPGFGLLILDLSLPDLPGAVLLERIRARAPALPVLVVSGAPWTPTAARAAFLAKPFGPAELAQAVEALLDPGSEPAGG